MTSIPKIMVVEDEATTARLIQKQLSLLGYEVVGTFPTGEEAIAQVQAIKPDIILMDINLAGELDGIEAAAQIHTAVDLPIIYLTAHAEEQVVHRAKATDPYGYITKPVKNIDLKIAIELALYKHQTEHKLSQLRRHHELILSAVSEGVIGLDRQGNITFVNPAAAQLLGYTVEELIGRSSHSTWHHAKSDGSPYQQDECPILETLSHGNACLFQEDFFWKKDGTGFPVRYSSNHIIEQGQVVGAVITFRDITERKRAEKALRDSTVRYKELFDNMGNGVAVYEARDNGRDFILQDCNRSAERIERVSKERLLGQSVSEIFPGSKDVGWLAVLQRVWQTDNPEHFLLRLHQDERLSGWRENYIYKLPTGEVVAVYEDVTEKKRAQEAEAKMAAQLEQAQKMEAIGTLAGGIAHDFNNILGVIIGFTEMSLSEVGERTLLGQNLTQVMQSAYRATDLVKQILTFSRQTEQFSRPLNITPIIKEVLKMLRAALPTTIEINTDIKGDGSVQADPTQIHQILMNLCTNAAHAMRADGGVLGIGLCNVDFNVVVPDTDIPPGPYVELSISDTGHGMNPAIRKRIFEPFFTTKGVGEGTGLGLSVVYGIVKNLQGTIIVLSEPGQGSTFKVYFPRIKEQPQYEPPIVIQPPTGQEQILFVDDEPALLDLGKQTLENLGYKVEIRVHPLEALKAFEAQPQKFDLVITDQTMPHMTGVKLAQELMRLRPDIPVIICTGFSELITPEKAEEIGIKAMLMKPLAIGELAKIVRVVLDDRRKNYE